MNFKYDISISQQDVKNNLQRLINQIYKLLPIREEGANWQKPLSTIMVELAGMGELIPSFKYIIFNILCKLEGLYSLTEDKDFILYRRIIFDCLTLMGKLVKQC